MIAPWCTTNELLKFIYLPVAYFSIERKRSVMGKHTIVEYFGGDSGHRCGYCGQSDSNLSHGMWAHSMAVEDYQDLIDRGWRRSGKYCYKPSMNKTCCPQYTIKCEVNKFKLSKSQKKVIKRVNKYLNNDIKPGGQKGDEKGRDIDDDPPGNVPMETACGVVNVQPTENVRVSDMHTAVTERLSEKDSCVADRSETSQADGMSDIATSDAGDKTESDKTGLKCKKAKQIRLERWQQKHGAESLPQPRKSQEGKSLEEFISEVSKDPAHNLELRLVQSCPRSKEFEDTFKQEYEVYKKYQMIIHKDDEDKPTEKQFTRFLVDSPLQSEDSYGSFHQQYWLDGVLIAVGVIDVLPRCTSSVYLFYDPDYSYLSLGTYSALRELEFTRKLSKKHQNLENYYMGFYIHSCPKMRYKGHYYPSYLVCPETYTWCPIEECRPILDAKKYARFAREGQDDEDVTSINLGAVLVLHMRQAMPYALYRAINPNSDDEDEMKEYVSLVGQKCAERMLIFRA